MAPTKQKALVLESKQGSFAIAEVDVLKPGPGQLLVKTHSAALNPVDWKIQKYGIIFEAFPAVLGTDGAGTVEALGEGVAGFAVGDRVFTQTARGDGHATFQQYFLANADVTAKAPENVSLDEAASIPVGLATAALGLFHADKPDTSAALTPPWEEHGKGRYHGQPLVVFGGSTSVGQFVIQLGRLAGFSPIIATASPRNTELVTSLGATHVLDRSLSAEALAAEVRRIAAKPIDVIFDAASLPDTQNTAYGLLAPGGALVIVLPDAVDPAKKVADKRVVHVIGGGNAPANRKLVRSLYSKLTGFLETGVIKPNRVEVLPNGLAGIIDGLEKLKADKVSGVKLIAHPQETR